MTSTDDQFKLVNLPGGGHSLRSLNHAETFHPDIGPVAEARILHVLQQKILERSAQYPKFILWDVGLGAAANALAAIEELKKSTGSIEIHSFDKSRAPLEFALKNASALGYIEPYCEEIKALCENGQVKIGENIHWFFHEGDFRELMSAPNIPTPHSVFYDPYSLNTNGEMWTLAHFKSLLPYLGKNCLLTNYTRSTSVRVTLLQAGYFVGQGVSIGKKNETTVAATALELLAAPLGKFFLERVRISGGANPILTEKLHPTPIDPDDFAKLLWHPQFAKKAIIEHSNYALL